MITKDIVQDFDQGDAQGNFKIIVVGVSAVLHPPLKIICGSY